MHQAGLSLCSRFAYPPNSFSLCGPDKQKDLKWYTTSGKIDKGTPEILSKFTTLFPYLTLIAYENNIRDPFSVKVVEAYWLGNNLLNIVRKQKYIHALSENIELRKKLKRKNLESVFQKVIQGGLPHHSYHVLNIYKRTGHLDINHTVETMDACIINWGKIVKVNIGSLVIQTKPLRIMGKQLAFDKPIMRKIIAQGNNDLSFSKLKVGDFVSYHWGYFCQKLTKLQLNNLIYYTSLSIKSANI